MKTVIDFTVNKNFSPFILAFFKQLWLAIAKYNSEQAYIFLNATIFEETDIPTNIEFLEIKSTLIPWLNKKKRLIMLNKNQVNNYILLHPQGFSICKKANNTFKKQNLLHPFAFVSFYNNQLFLPFVTKTINVIPVLPNAMSLSWAQAEEVKKKYTHEKAFFLFIGDIKAQHQLLELLKAFSLFKKWQQSNMQLVIAGYTTTYTAVFEKELLTYKYKKDVILLKNLPFNEIGKLASASYALIQPVTHNIMPLAILFAVQVGVACIASDNEANKQITSAAIWINNNSLQENMAKAMMLLYKDEGQKQKIEQQMKDQTQQIKCELLMEQIGTILIR